VHTIFRSFALSCAVSAACSGTSTPGAAQSTSDIASAICNKLNACSPLLIKASFGDLATCATREAISFANVLAANGTGWTPAGAESCSQALANASCSDLLGGHGAPPAACQPVGHLAQGAACGDDTQCQSSYCNIAAGNCGACGAPPAAAAACMDDSQCPRGAVCSTSGACVKPAAVGATCGNTQPCQTTLVCKAGVCAARDGAGASCTLTAGSTDSCDNLGGAFCNGMTCVIVGFAESGQPCGAVNGGLTACSAGGKCTNGTCQAPPADGAACDPNGPSCMSPAGCQNGVCIISNPGSCH